MTHHTVPLQAPHVSTSITNDADRIRLGCNGSVTLGAMMSAQAAAKRLQQQAKYAADLLAHMIEDAKRAERQAAREAHAAQVNNAKILKARGIASAANDFAIPAHP